MLRCDVGGQKASLSAERFERNEHLESLDGHAPARRINQSLAPNAYEILKRTSNLSPIKTTAVVVKVQIIERMSILPPWSDGFRGSAMFSVVTSNKGSEIRKTQSSHLGGRIQKDSS